MDIRPKEKDFECYEDFRSAKHNFECGINDMRIGLHLQLRGDGFADEWYLKGVNYEIERKAGLVK